MSGTSGEGAFTTTKATTSDAPSGPTLKDQQAANKTNPASLEEDDEFEDFPVDGTLGSCCLRNPKEWGYDREREGDELMRGVDRLAGFRAGREQRRRRRGGGPTSLGGELG